MSQYNKSILYFIERRFNIRVHSESFLQVCDIVMLEVFPWETNFRDTITPNCNPFTDLLFFFCFFFQTTPKRMIFTRY